MSFQHPALADTHCHLNLDVFQDDLPEVLTRARKAGLDRILVPGIDFASSKAAVLLAASESEIYAAIGVHPHESTSWDVAVEQNLENLTSLENIVAIGEIGLDYYRDYAPHDIQRQAFSDQLNLAARLELPVIIHQRDSMKDVLSTLEKWTSCLPQSLSDRPGVLHSFSGSIEDAVAAMELGFFIGISGPVTFKNAPILKQVVEELDLERILLETDAPYLAPHPLRGKRNEPANVVYMADAIAAIKRTSVEAVMEITSKNASRLFIWREETGNAHLSGAYPQET